MLSDAFVSRYGMRSRYVQDFEMSARARAIDNAIAGLGLYGLVARLPQRLRHQAAQRRFGWMDYLETIRAPGQTGYSLHEPEAMNLIFPRVPKTGSVSVAKALFGNMGPPHIPIFAYLEFYGARRFDAMTKAAFVRSPWKRVASAFYFLKEGGYDHRDAAFAARHLCDYEEASDFVKRGLRDPRILEWTHFRPQTYYLRDPRTGRVDLDFLGRLESLDADYARLCEMLGIETPEPLPVMNKTARKGPGLDAEALDIVAEVYAEDIAALGYDRPS